ncbi:17 kDa surface antigen [Methylocaldum marinum]|uniref:17 kDa surface antigen n=1 Tax=Methylocaldum marinum TaxID=1432792 RepID=A0A250KPA5_9GAMM|nr:YMGG-like glycine zipper-containing protein [Methylocaldum marinum]BBA33407.1 17 kDa surface antigen [Methylocaldum marinum]
MNDLKLGLMVLSLTITLTGCASTGYHGHNDYAYRNTVTGAAIGAAGGALLGHAADDGGRGALVGGAVGAMVGGAAGYYMDQKKKRDSYYNRHPNYNNYNDPYYPSQSATQQPRTYPYQY